ncbi:MAG: PilN domain-containing protein [Firmicutes bacterium]|nr:PilN domain-containing protein [Bacillota bacterium]
MRVNLLPTEMVRRVRPNWRAVLSLVGVLLLAAVTGVFYTALQSQVGRIEASIRAMEEEYRHYTAALARKQTMDELRTLYEEKSRFVQQLSGQVRWNGVMDELRAIVPRTVVLHSVSSDAAGNISIAGQSGSWQALSQFVVNIQAGSCVTDPDVKSVTWNEELGAFVFSMTCKTKAGVGQSGR